MPYQLMNPVTVQVKRQGQVIDSRLWDVVNYQGESIQTVGAGYFQFQVWKSFTTQTPGPDVRIGDDLLTGGGVFTVALNNDYPFVYQVIGWGFEYNLTVNITTAGGAADLTGWPAIIRPANAQERATIVGNDEQHTPVDAIGYVPYSDYIQPGDQLKVVTVNGVTASPAQATLYEIEIRDDLFSAGKQLQLNLWRKG